MRILVCGSREWTNVEAIRKALRLRCKKSKHTTILHGCAKGADQIAEDIAQEFGYGIMGFEADWATHGKAAGPIRNSEMLSRGEPNVVLAFSYDLKESRGTADTVRKAKKAGVSVFVYPDTDNWYKEWKRNK